MGDWVQNMMANQPMGDMLAHLEQYARPVLASKKEEAWVDRYPLEFQWITTSTFDFAVKMRNVLKQFGGLTPGQLAAVQKCMRYNEPARSGGNLSSVPAVTAEPTRAANPVAPRGDIGASLDLSSLPPGMYAVPSGETRLKVCVARPHIGKWAGFIFVSDGAAYGSQRRYGMQKPNGLYQGDIREQLRAIVADPEGAMAAYGKLTGRCGACGRPLENEESVARGIGPICAGRMGW